MTLLAFLVLCVQACLVQNAFSQYLGPARYDGLLPGSIGPLGAGCGSPGYGLGAELIAPGITGYPAGAAYGLGAEFIAPGITTFPAAAAYGGAGVGDVAVAGEMPVAGTTLVAGQVPILGAVRFAGELPAAGTVSIAGNCGCGCGAQAFY
ncbi:unnamed protein product [Euphydryas editha]|uniref:Chorion class A protein Ld2/Ld41 n=1 Tax=Euphydryas editha TaxID=104508 RepID=A0AAU9TDF2_EUPED|nr:unnamed protein product [Euphydryas editha]